MPESRYLASQTDQVSLEAKVAELEDRIGALEAKLAGASKQAGRGVPAKPEMVQPTEFEAPLSDDGLHTRNKGSTPPVAGNREPDARSTKARPEFPDIGGNYFLNGERLPENQCKIVQVDARLTVINPKKEAAPAHFNISGTHILVPRWNLRGEIVGGEIYWSKGLENDSGKPDHRWVP